MTTRTKKTLKEKIETLTAEAYVLESRAAALSDRATAKRRLAEKLYAQAEEAVS